MTMLIALRVVQCGKKARKMNISIRNSNTDELESFETRQKEGKKGKPNACV